MKTYDDIENRPRRRDYAAARAAVQAVLADGEVVRNLRARHTHMNIPTPEELAASAPPSTKALEAALSAMKSRPGARSWAVRVGFDDRDEMDRAMAYAYVRLLDKRWTISSVSKESVGTQREPSPAHVLRFTVSA